jgi:hypothetical protein
MQQLGARPVRTRIVRWLATLAVASILVPLGSVSAAQRPIPVAAAQPAILAFAPLPTCTYQDIVT